MGEVLGVLAVMAYLAVISAAVWAHRTRRSARDDLKAGLAAIESAISGLGGCLASLIGCLFFLVLGLVGLFFVVWLVKRMWEAA